ncbi:MAG: diguanylate cyclase [Patescibacteria group bacterium]
MQALKHSARVGGDEFTLLLPIGHTTVDGNLEDTLQLFLEKMQNAVSNRAYTGYSILKRGESMEGEELLTKADRMLVANKEREKNAKE